MAPAVDEGATLTMRFLIDLTSLAVERQQQQLFADATRVDATTPSRQLALVLNTNYHAFFLRIIGRDGPPTRLATALSSAFRSPRLLLST